MRLMISETPCNAIRAKPTGSSSLTGQRISPPAFEEASLSFQEFDEPGPGEIDEDHADRQQEQKTADDVDPDARALGHHAVDEIDANMLVHLERVGRAEQHHAGEHVPLDFQPAVRALAEQIAAGGIARADQAGEQHQPIGDHADLRVHPIDGPAQSQQNGHVASFFAAVIAQRTRALLSSIKTVARMMVADRSAEFASAHSKTSTGAPIWKVSELAGASQATSGARITTKKL